MHDDACLRVVLDREGDHTAYCLCLVDAASGRRSGQLAGVPRFRSALCLRHAAFPPGLRESAGLRRRGAMRASTAACAGDQLSRQGLRQLPPAVPRPHRAGHAGMAGAPRAGPRHRAGRDAGVHRRLPQLLPGRGRHRGLSRHRAPAHLGAPACAAGRLPHARRLQCARLRHAGIEQRPEPGPRQPAVAGAAAGAGESAAGHHRRATSSTQRGPRER